jgi:hypothetical protein
MSFQSINAEDFVVSSDSISSTLWTPGTPGLSTFFTSSAQYSGLNPKSFFLDVYNTGSTLSGSEVQFSVAYGHKFGSGSKALNASVPQNSATRMIYGQFRNLIYGDENASFNFGTGNTSSIDIYAVVINRARYKEKLFVGTFTLFLTGSAGEISLIDNSRASSTVTYCDAGRIYDIVSGSNGTIYTGLNSNGFSAGSGSYGKFLPDVGLIILNPRALVTTTAAGGIGLSVDTGSSNTATANVMNLYQAMASSSLNKPSTGSFYLNSEETVTSDYIFIRVKNAEMNYSTNPSMISGSGDLIYPNFINNPQTYFTTVGLYNNNNDLLAVAKLSRPLVKDFTKEALVRVKLDF